MLCNVTGDANAGPNNSSNVNISWVGLLLRIGTFAFHTWFHDYCRRTHNSSILVSGAARRLTETWWPGHVGAVLHVSHGRIAHHSLNLGIRIPQKTVEYQSYAFVCSFSAERFQCLGACMRVNTHLAPPQCLARAKNTDN